VDDYRQELCYPAFVIHDKKEKCRARIAENRCPWITESEYIDYANHNYSSINGEFQCEPKHVGTEADLGHHPKNCEYGPGWKGILKATNETGRYMIDWTSLVKQQSCVEWVHIIDKQTGLSKDFWTPRNDVNMPIEYAKTTCEMNIFIYGHEKCYSVDTKVPCKKEEEKEEEKTATFETIGIVCAVVFPIAVLVVIVTFLVQKKDLRQNSEQKQELNDQYGRYYQGNEYNTAIDNNPRYNEYGGGGDAVISDQNVYYQLDESNDNNLGDKKNLSSDNGNVYHQL